MAKENGWVDQELIEAIERDIVDQGEKVTFDDIAGLEHTKQLLQETVMLPQIAPHLFEVSLWLVGFSDTVMPWRTVLTWCDVCLGWTAQALQWRADVRPAGNREDAVGKGSFERLYVCCKVDYCDLINPNVSTGISHFYTGCFARVWRDLLQRVGVDAVVEVPR